MLKKIFTILLFVGYSLSYSQSVIYVDSSRIASWTGVSWNTAKKTISEAITASSSGDTIKIAKGTYFEGSELIIPHELFIYGGYSSTGGTTQNTTTNKTIIDGANTHRVISKDGAFNLTLNHLFIQNGSATNGGGISNQNGGVLTIEYSIVKDNNASGNGGGIFSNLNTISTVLKYSKIYNNIATGDGGGIHVYTKNASVTITNSDVYDNISGGHGGGVYSASSGSIGIISSTVTVTDDSEIYRNTASSNGGGIYSNSKNSTVTITNSSLWRNSATDNGGGVYSYSSNTNSEVIVTNSVFNLNTISTGNGGGIYSKSFYGNSGYSVTLKNSFVRLNYITSPGGYGAGIYATDDVKLDSSYVYSNTSTGYGGGIYLARSSSILTATDSYIYGNIAEWSGGGIHGYSMTLTNSNIYNNIATLYNGGGIFSDNPSYSNSPGLILTNCKLYSNTAGTDGGGIYAFFIDSGAYANRLKLTNSSIYNNTASGDGGGIYSSSSISGYPLLTLTNSNVCNNTANNGGGIYSVSATSSLTLTNSILAYNKVTGNNPHYHNAGITNINYSYLSGIDLSGTGVGNFNGITVKPLFIDTTLRNYRLLATSLLISAGINDSIPNDFFDVDNDANTTEQIPIDLDYNKRIMGGTVDLGAYESCDNSSIIYDTSCNTYISPSGNYTWITSGVYLDTLKNLNSEGCDSVITVNLTINSSTTSSIHDTVCGSYTSPSGNYNWTISGIYTDTIPNENGCDSIITINLVIGGQQVIQNDTNTICKGDSILINNNWYYTKTTVKDTLFAGFSSHCDTIINSTILIDSVSPSVYLGKDIVTCITDSVILVGGNNYNTYLWSNGAITNNILVKGSFLGAGFYTYTLEVTQLPNNCKDTDTVNIEFTSCSIGINEKNEFSLVNIYPNPTKGNFTIDLGENKDVIEIKIYNSNGKLIRKSTHNEGVINIELNTEKGLYFIHLTNNKGESKVLKLNKI